MKKTVVACLMCVFLLVLSFNTGAVYAFSSERLEFFFQDKLYHYNLEPNIKKSSLFIVVLWLKISILFTK